MGNPPILGRDECPPPAATPARVEKPQPLVLWNVYAMRCQGQKLARERAIQTGRTGYLTIRPRGEPFAVLADRHGNQLALIDNVRIRLLNPAGGMLLHGTELWQDRKRVEEYPQSWWCVVAAAQGIASLDTFTEHGRVAT